MAEPNVPTPTPRLFPTTHWSLVVRAGGEPGRDKSKALSELVERYLPALRAHLLYRKRIDPDKADDLLQSFLTVKVLERDLVSQAEQQKGKFRTFLLTSMDRFILNQIRDEKAKRRSPESGKVGTLEDGMDAVDPSERPDEAFDIAWARRVLDQAIERMREECKASARPDLWTVFEGRALAPALHGPSRSLTATW